MRSKPNLLKLSNIFVLLLLISCGSSPKITFQQKTDQIDILVKDKPFTSYRFSSQLTKPILYLVYSPSGIEITRGFPFKEVPGENRDHPHHTGIFFTYDLVNGEGFWNNTTSPPQIKHIEFLEQTEEKNQSVLSTLSNWDGKNGTLLIENRNMIFSLKDDKILIDFEIVLTANDTSVVFRDTKEGMFAIRVADWFREDQTGNYLSSNGDQTEKNIWGTRAKWVRLEGKKDDKIVGIAILNHPESINYPTFWHARGYGLFSANPLGQSVFQQSRGEENPLPFNFTLIPGDSVLFKFRMVFYEGESSKEEIDMWFDEYK